MRSMREHDCVHEKWRRMLAAFIHLIEGSVDLEQVAELAETC